MIDFTITLTGLAPLLMHNSRLSNPLDPATKALKKLTGKRNKTDDDHEQIARLEFQGGIYSIPGVGPYIPGENIARALVDGAKLTKMGVKVTRGVFITTDDNPLIYKGPRDEDALWNAGYYHMKSVKVGTARTMRCRPMFQPGWSVQADGVLDPSVIELEDLANIADNAGSLIGLGDWRPRFGRFTATVERVSKANAA